MYLKNLIRTSTLIGILVLSLTLFGCATLKIPAPQNPVKPMSEPVAESSTINVPVVVSVSSLTNKLDQLFSRSGTLNKLNQQNDITGKIQGLLNGQSGPDLLNNLYLRLAIGKVWDALQSPIRLNYDLSLLLNPEAVHISPATRQGDSAKFVVGLVARPKLVSGDFPKTSPQAPPSFSMASGAPESGFHIVVDNELSFDFISNELTKKLEGKTYPVNGNTITIEKVKVFGSGDSVIIEAKITGTAEGAIYLTGIPAYDEFTATIYIKDLDYTIETKNVLAKTADWLLHTKFRDSLADRAKWSIGDKIDAAKDMLSDALNRKLNQYVSINGKIQSVRAVAVGTTNTSLKAVLIADGIVGVSVF